MVDYKLLQKVQLKAHHHATGKTHHFENQEPITNIAELRIVKYEDDAGYYLLYFDENQKELTDTYHESIESAHKQAEWEFQVKPSEWMQN